MSALEDTISSVLSDPQLMEQLQSMAQSLGISPEGAAQAPPQPALVQGLMSGGIDQNQQALLQALAPYVSRERLGRLERAMQAAAMAQTASTFLRAGAKPGRRPDHV